MASLLGFTAKAPPPEVPPGNENTPHYHFIHSMMLPSTVKIQKELRGRRFKDVQSKLSEAVMSMHTFQFETWPPAPQQEEEKKATEEETPRKPRGVSLDSHLETNSSPDKTEGGEGAPEVESVIGDFSQAPQDDDLRPFDDVSAATGTTTATSTSRESLTTMGEAADLADSLTRIAMHKTVTICMEAYIMVMMHPQKTNNACEQALECVKQFVLREYVSGRAGVKDDNTSETPAASPPDTKPTLLDRIVEGIQKCSESNKDTVQNHVIDTLKEVMLSRQCGVHQASMLLAIRSVFHIHLVTKSPTVQQSSKAALMEMVANIIVRMEDAATLYNTDAYYLMRSLVKLSSKELPGIDDNTTTPTNFLAQQFLTTTTVDPLALNNKVLSLELISQIMECAGHTFCHGEKFIHLVQSQLCVSLLKNCMSNNTQVAFMSQKVFLVLVYKFKAHLKDEIQVFMTNIFLRVLESENASFPQKALVLESLRSMCRDPVLLTQVFLHYDCDFDAMNLYKDIVFHLTKISAKSTSLPLTNLSKKDTENAELGVAAVEVLVTILQAFLTALDMEATNEEINDTAGKKIRQRLEIENVGGTTPSVRRALTTREPLLRVLTEGELTVEDLERLQHTPPQTDASAAQTPNVESSSVVAGRIVDAFDRKRNAEQNFELGAVKFTLDVKKGINFFVENGFVELDAKEIALFFLASKEKLDKTQMGEVLGREPDAAFIKNKDIDAEVGGPGFYARVLHHYIDAMDFTGLLFDDAIRLFLSGFRLPGEAQKIDRIMEKFAGQFTRQNLDVFTSADTAFVLAFSVIMLNTDLHNPSIKPEKRMTVKSFLANNRGIGENGTDLPEDVLTGIFNRIKEQPFSLKEDDAAREKAQADAMQDSYFGLDGGGYLGFGLVGPPNTEEVKREKFKKERDEMMTATEQLIRRRKGRAASARSVVDEVAPADVVKPMFDVTWGPIIGILSQVLECSYDDQNIAVCLNGFVYAIRVAAHSDMPLARDTFVNSLAKFTLLGSLKEMKYKNMMAIRTLMSIAISDGGYLGASWAPVLQCISKLARMRMSASGLASDESFLEDSNATTKTPTKQPVSKSYFGSQTKVDNTKEMEEMNGRAVLETVSEQLIDQVFASTVKLSAHSLGEFIRQLVAVSTSEIEGDTKRGITGVASSGTGSSHGGDDGPSIFSLQRLVEVADYNMDVRPRLVWTQVWEIMAEFFSKIGCHRNSMVSVFAIDSLKQLSSKFLEKPELSEFNFQRMFLRPFLLVMENPATRQDIRELILECLDQLVSRKGHNLQSGWKIVFDVIMAAAHGSSDRITLLSLNILQRMLDGNLDQLTRLAKVHPEIEDIEEMSAVEKRNRDSNAEDFVGMCRASLAFVQAKESEATRPLGVSMRAICHMAIYADLVADGRILPPVSGAQSDKPDCWGYSYDGLDEKETLDMALWRTILEGLADGVRSKSRSRAGGVGCLLQRGSVLAIRSIMLRHGRLFSKKQLEVILKTTLLPAFQEAAEGDKSPVIGITSESPAVSSLDFLVEPLPLPPARYDRGLLKFEEVARSVECAPSRPLGPAELLLEACFTDMRHGGDGDLTQAYKFAKKDMRNNVEGEQPFPDSWIATTAPVAFGCLTDIASEVLLPHGAYGANNLWPLIGDLFQRWCNGEVEDVDGRYVRSGWAPCEALVRIASREIVRFAERLPSKISKMEDADREVWGDAFVMYFKLCLDQTLDMEHDVKNKLLGDKLKAFTESRGEQRKGDQPDSETDSLGWVKLVPILKIRCIAAHNLHRGVSSLLEKALAPLLTEELASGLLTALNRSRKIAEEAVRNEDLAHAFQEYMLSEWGADEEMGEEALVNIARLSQSNGSDVFFLTQTAGATSAVIQLLSVLFAFRESEEEKTWDREDFATPHLLDVIKDVLTKFVESEEKDGHRIDPNMLRGSTESGVKVAVYCTSFGSVVVGLLKSILTFDDRQMQLHGAALFPMIVALVRVRNEEIRLLVQQLLLEKFAPLLGVNK